VLPVELPGNASARWEEEQEGKQAQDKRVSQVTDIPSNVPNVHYVHSTTENNSPDVKNVGSYEGFI
jgi:hypothetical protein